MRRGKQSKSRDVRRAIHLVRVAAMSASALCLVTGTFFSLPETGAFGTFPSWIAAAQADDDDNWRREARDQDRETRRQQREQVRENLRQQREADKEVKRQQRDAEQEANRQQREAEREAKRQQRDMQQEARRQQSEMEKEGRNQQRAQSRNDDSAGKDQVSKRDDDSGRAPVTTGKGDVNSDRRADTKSAEKDSGKSTNNDGVKSGSEGSSTKPGTAVPGKPVQSGKTAAQNKPEKNSDEDKPLPPPKTVVEMLERIATPAKPKPQPVPAPAASPVKIAAPAKPAAGKQASNGKPALAVRRGAPDFELLEHGMFRPHEILATNLSAEEKQFAEANGFKSVSSVASPGETGTVSSLIVPPGMTETAALQFLERAAPSAQFGPNHVYRIIPAADGPTPAAARDGQAAADTGAKGSACTAGDCIARELLAWKPATKQCARRVRIGIIDTSFDVSHPAFNGRKFSLEQFSGNHAIARGDWHGTAVLSVLAGNASSSTPGLIPDADFFLASTFRADAQGNAAADTISVLKALGWLDKRNVNIINMSFSGPRNDQIEAAITAMAAKGVVFVAAAGNKGPSAPPSYPAAYSQVVAVTAISKKLNSYLHANRGDYVDVAAPGVQVLTALPEGRQGYRTGTSFATPFVTGLLAAMPAVRKGAADKVEMLSRISFQDLGEPGRDAIYGEGLPKAPERCNDIGGVASLPWSNAAKRMSVGAPTPADNTLARPASQ